ncbi:uncharacterized protein LOC114539313 [Dendronephthya gigantea]|uniref:uncharacterized protein LOC114539313 n=1 Tax=Dendronephthya gigantea TaxID=151771 RepID=UPI0010693513|nr:uncharacterized protein LOC114539313 [Dendronephthya gigantea]
MESCQGREILKNEPGDFPLKLNKWLPQSDKDWNVCWRASRDGWGGSTFHSQCDGKAPTLTIVKVVKDNKTFIFGGYATVSWTDPGTENDYHKSDPSSFLFSLRNNDDLPPFKSLYVNAGYGIYRYNGFGPTFGGGHDLYISNNAGSTASSYSKLGHTYQTPPGYTFNQPNTRSLLAGSYYFTPSEVEVLY